MSFNATKAKKVMQRASVTVTVQPRLVRPLRQGLDAGRRGLPVHVCPWSYGVYRRAWFEGYYLGQGPAPVEVVASGSNGTYWED